ncbi:MAG: 5' nucleotidase, NT5C type [Desulfobulbaceae bacterium]
MLKSQGVRMVEIVGSSDLVRVHPSRLGFDFDGVVADTAEAFIRLCCEEYGYCSIRLEDITEFEVERCLDLDPGIVDAVFARILCNSVDAGLQPMPGSIRVLAELTELAPVTLITARPYPQPVRDWLDAVMPAPVSRRIRVVAMGAHDDKPKHIRQHGLDSFIDDRAETCFQLDEAGITPIIFSQPWNQGRHAFASVRTWEEIRALCL